MCSVLLICLAVNDVALYGEWPIFILYTLCTLYTGTSRITRGHAVAQLV